jgi:hypothetical protein
MAPIGPATAPIITTRGIELNPLHPDSITIGLSPEDLALLQPLTTPAPVLSIDRFTLSLSVGHNESRLPILPTNSCAFFFVNLTILEPSVTPRSLETMSPIYESYGLVTVVHEDLNYWESKGTWIVGAGRAPTALCPSPKGGKFVENFAPTTMSQTSMISYGPTIGTPITFPKPGKYAIFVQAARTPFQEKRRTLIVGRWIVEVKDGAPMDPEVLAYLNREPGPGNGGGYGPYPTNNGSAYDPNANAGSSTSSGGSSNNTGLIVGIVILGIVSAASLTALGVVLYKQKGGSGSFPSVTTKSADVGLDTISRSAKVEEDGRPFVRMDEVDI